MHADGIPRRRFLMRGMGGVAAIAGAPRSWRDMRSPWREALPSTRAVGRSSPGAWLPDPVPADHLRALAAAAMDAARSAGADFADIRIGMQRRVSVYGFPNGPLVGMSAGYGVRAWRDRTWAFQHGNVMTADAVAETARAAVTGAQVYAKINAQLAPRRRSMPLPAGLSMLEAWAPAPVVTGEWRVPVEIDPFTVPVDDYQRVIGSLVDVVAPLSVHRNVHALGYVLGWQAETRVFASTAGALVTQYTMRGGIGIQGSAKLSTDRDNEVWLNHSGFSDVCAGFETALRSDVPATIQEIHERAARWRELPMRPFRDIGRFPVVLDGATAARAVGNTISAALDGDRVSGLEADASGRGFLSPPVAVLQAETPLLSPLLTARVDRALPSPMAIQWDDDGVVAEPYTVLDRGRVVDFHTTRETAPMLADWYQTHGMPQHSHGGALATTPESLPRGTGGHLHVAPTPATASLDDLVRDISHGFLVINGGAGATPGLTGGVIATRPYSVIVEVQRGIPVSRTPLRMQFLTRDVFGKHLVALGDATTLGTAESGTSKGIPWQYVPQWASAPAMFCRDVDVVL